MDEITNVQNIERPIEIITEEINFYKASAGASILEIGKRLNEAKAQLSHGEWGTWLKEKVEFSEASAQRFMRLSKEYSNPSPVTDLGVSKALILLALPENEREDFISEKHTIDGDEKTVSEMSKRELEKAIAAKKEADAQIAKLEEELESIKNIVSENESALADANSKIEGLEKELSEAPESSAEISEEQINEIKQKAKDEMQSQIVELKKKVDKLKRQKQDADNEKSEIEKKIETFKSDYEKMLAKKDKERAELEKHVDELNAQIKISNSAAMSEFKVRFTSAQAEFNKMIECISEIEKQDAASAEKLKNALRQLAENVRSAV